MILTTTERLEFGKEIYIKALNGDEDTIKVVYTTSWFVNSDDNDKIKQAKLIRAALKAMENLEKLKDVCTIEELDKIINNPDNKIKYKESKSNKRTGNKPNRKTFFKKETKTTTPDFSDTLETKKKKSKKVVW